jgi:hypothetical protein
MRPHGVREVMREQNGLRRPASLNLFKLFPDKLLDV